MRIRLPLGRGLFFLVAFLLALLALLPLRLAADWLRLGDAGVAARDAVGSVWGGVVHGAQYRTTQLGDLVAELNALPLLAGRARIDVGRNDGVLGETNRADRLAAAVTVSRNSYGLSGATLRLPLGPESARLPITAVDLSDVSARFVRGNCAAASGAVTIETTGSIAGLPLPTAMTGNARCDGAALLLPLAGASGAERLDLRFSGNERYSATLSVRPTDPMIGARLAASGFAVAGGAYSLTLSGRMN